VKVFNINLIVFNNIVLKNCYLKDTIMCCVHVVHNTKYELFYNFRKECNNNHLKMLKLRLSSWLAVTGPVLGRLVLSSTAPSSLAVPPAGDGNCTGEDST